MTLQTVACKLTMRTTITYESAIQFFNENNIIYLIFDCQISFFLFWHTQDIEVIEQKFALEQNKWYLEKDP